MEKLQGVLLYHDGHVTLEQFKAEHGPVKISTEGYCDFLPDGGWNMHFAGLTVDRLRLDRDLIQALPERLKKAVLTLNPTGPINLRGNLDLIHDGRQGEPLLRNGTTADRHDARRLQCGVKLENIHGSVTLVGQVRRTTILLPRRTKRRFAELQGLSIHARDGPHLDRRPTGAAGQFGR